MVENERRDPDELLADVQREEARARRGRLRVFFGASAGVGKTYSMLEAARVARTGGADIVVGYVEPHGRADTERLLEGLEQLPFLEVRYHGIVRREFDLDTALRRAPAIVLVDELAHSNIAEGEPLPRHAKRWQDVEELLDAGISVWTTLNVQHLESLNDVVAGITGVRQQETLPDRIFDEADEVELIDLPPDDLLARLRAGKVYAADRVLTATEGFFRKPNLLALRELALRRTADRVDAAALEFAAQAPSSRPWLARDRFLIAISPDDQAEQLVRIGKRFADALDAEWLVVSVETPKLLKLSESARNRRIDVLRLAESLGAETVTLDGVSAAETLLEYAGLRNVTRIVIGEAKRTGWRAWLRRSTTTDLVRRGRGFDVSVIARRETREIKSRDVPDHAPAEIRWERYWAALLISACCTGVAAIMYPYFALTNLVMVYLLGATVAALRLGRGPAIFSAIANVAALDFCFVPPRFTFAVSNLEYLLTFAVMLAMALVIATLVANVRAQTRVAGARERRTSLLYAMSRELAATRSFANLARVAVKHVAETFASRATVLLPDASGHLHEMQDAALAGWLGGADLSVAQWVFDHGRPAGLGTDTLPAAIAQYLPLKGTQKTLGVLAVLPTQRRRLLLPEQRQLLETFAGQIALAIERARTGRRGRGGARRGRNGKSAQYPARVHFARPARSARGDHRGEPRAQRSDRAAERRRVRETRPVHRCQGAGDVGTHFQCDRFDEFRGGESAPAARLANPRRSHRRRPRTFGGTVRRPLRRCGPPADITPGPGRCTAHYARAGQSSRKCHQTHAAGNPDHRVGRTRRRSGAGDGGRLGAGLPPGHPERLFAKFQRGRDEYNLGGAGLGLAICRAIVNAHGGHISAMQRPGGGARFTSPCPPWRLRPEAPYSRSRAALRNRRRSAVHRRP